MNIVIYLDDEREFLGYNEKDRFDTVYFTRHVYQAKKFDTLEQAQNFLDSHFPYAAATFLSVITE